MLNQAKEYFGKIQDIKDQYPEEFDAALGLTKDIFDKIRNTEPSEMSAISYENIGKAEALKLAQSLIRKTREERQEFLEKLDVVGDTIGKVLKATVTSAMGM